MGVWIETLILLYKNNYSAVTPCMGVWIETLSADKNKEETSTSHPVWVCGLKHEHERG